jgi:hypothetical protein
MATMDLTTKPLALWTELLMLLLGVAAFVGAGQGFRGKLAPELVSCELHGQQMRKCLSETRDTVKCRPERTDTSRLIAVARPVSISKFSPVALRDLANAGTVVYCNINSETNMLHSTLRASLHSTVLLHLYPLS